MLLKAMLAHSPLLYNNNNSNNNNNNNCNNNNNNNIIINDLLCNFQCWISWFTASINGFKEYRSTQPEAIQSQLEGRWNQVIRITNYTLIGYVKGLYLIISDLVLLCVKGIL